MIKGVKICGVSDIKTLDYIINHPHPPKFVGFICNFKKSKRYVSYEYLKKLINVDRKNINFVSVLVNPDNQTLEKISKLNFDYYQLYDVDPNQTKFIKKNYGKKIISALTIEKREDVNNCPCCVGTPDQVLTEANLRIAFGEESVGLGREIFLDDPHHTHATTHDGDKVRSF